MFFSYIRINLHTYCKCVSKDIYIYIYMSMPSPFLKHAKICQEIQDGKKVWMISHLENLAWVGLSIQ